MLVAASCASSVGDFSRLPSEDSFVGGSLSHEGSAQAAQAQAPFCSAAVYQQILADPDRLRRLEWHRVRRRGCHSSGPSQGFLSHSFLLCSLEGGYRVRLEKFVDTGYVETRFFPASAADNGTGKASEIYSGCTARGSKLVRPMRFSDFSLLAAGPAAIPYSVRRQNCHHFARDIWNAAVVLPLRTRHYPDRCKTNLLRGMSKPFAAFKRNVSSPCPATSSTNSDVFSQMSCSDFTGSPPLSSSSPEDSCCDEKTGQVSEESLTGLQHWLHLMVSEPHDGGDAMSSQSGEFCAAPSSAFSFKPASRLLDWGSFLKVGWAYTLQADGELEETGLPLPRASSSALDSISEESLDAWAREWIPGAGDASLRLAERVTPHDVTDLLARLPPPACSEASSWRRRASSPSRFFSGRSSGSSASGAGSSWHVASQRFVALRSISGEMRLAVYAVLTSGVGSDCIAQRLRLLSGDAHCGNEFSYAFSVRRLDSFTSEITAMDLLLGELESLRVAVVTGDWGFVTLL